jgi:hypothetical protein
MLALWVNSETSAKQKPPRLGGDLRGVTPEITLTTFDNIGVLDAKTFPASGGCSGDHGHVSAGNRRVLSECAKYRNGYDFRGSAAADRAASRVHRSGCHTARRRDTSSQAFGRRRAGNDDHRANDEAEEKERQEGDPAAGDRQVDRQRHRSVTLPPVGAEGVSAIHSIREAIGVNIELGLPRFGNISGGVSADM